MKARLLGAALAGLLAAAVPGTAGASGFVLRGTVVGRGGAPVTEGMVSFGDFWTGSREYAGRFEAEVPEVPPGRYPLVYTDERAGALTFTLVAVAAGQREAKVTLRAGEGLVAQGRVVSADMPDGVPNAQVTVEGVIDGRPWKHTWLAGEHGKFALYGEALTGFSVTATAPFHQPSVPAVIAAPLPAEVELRLPRQTMVIGQVLTEARGFIRPEATVAVFTKGYMMYTKTDVQGRFQFDAPPPGDYIIWGFAPGRMPGGTTLRLAPEQQVVGLTLHLPFAPLGLVSGSVFGPDGKAGVAGATVEFVQMLSPPPGAMPGGGAGGFAPELTYTAVSGANGYYSVMLPVLPSDVVAPQTNVTIRAKGYLPRHYTVYREALFAGPVDFQVFRGGRLHGTVRFADGRPLPEGMTVDVQVPSGLIGPAGASSGSSSPRATLDLATGRFDFGLVQPGENWLTASVNWDTIAQLKVNVVEGGDQEVELVVTPAEAAAPQTAEPR
jgi:hypothetical protein